MGVSGMCSGGEFFVISGMGLACAFLDVKKKLKNIFQK